MLEKVKAQVYGVMKEGKRIIVHYLLPGTDLVIEKRYNIPSAEYMIEKNGIILHVGVPPHILKKIPL